MSPDKVATNSEPAAKAAISGILEIKKHGNSEVKSLQEIHAEIHDK